MSTINIEQFEKIVEFNIDNNIKRAILGLGASGIGKSAVIKQITERKNMGLIDLRLLLYTETDLKGIPFPNEDKTRTKWLPNDILPNVERDGERGILLVEELTSAPKRVQAAAYQLIQDRKLGEYILPEGWFIVALGNREDDNGVFVQMPSPLANRFEIHENWYIGGHSLGGAMAASYAAKHQDNLKGVVLLAAYPTKELDIPVLSIYGSEDGVLNREKYKDSIGMAKNLSEIIIDGGNHAQFGNYGEQSGDNKSKISSEKQWNQTTNEILNFIK